MRTARILSLVSMGAASVIAVACHHEEPPAATPVVAPSSVPTAATTAPVTAAPTATDAGADETATSEEEGDSFGAGGLGMAGVGEGGGGRGEGIGLGDIGTLGHGADGGSGFGNGHGRLGGTGGAAAPSLRQGTTKVNGRLPPEVIQRIARQNFGRFKLCYEKGLAKKADLQGKVTVKFVIDGTGSVSSAADGGSDLPDKDVVTCVVNGFSKLKFPQPEGGVVTVVYPIVFSPGDAPAAAPPKKK